jgi:hypothetical protein
VLKGEPQHGGDSSRAWLLAAVLGFIAAHLILGVLDLRRPEVFLRADRGAARLHDIEQLLASRSGSEAGDYLATHGVPGDYAAHAVLYATGGRAAVILSQVALLLVSGAGVVGLARLVGLTPKAQAAAFALYYALPHSMVFAHELATEALEVPLLVLSTWLFCEAIRKEGFRLVLASAALLALATLIRPITLLWPIVVLVIAAAAGRTRFGAALCALALAPVLLWMSFVWAHTGVFGLGESGHSLNHNLYLRVEEVASTLSQSEAAEVKARYLRPEAQGRMGVIEYAGAALHHPRAFAAAAARDGLVFWGKSGVERFTVDYLGSDVQFKALTSVDHGWRAHLDREGAASALRYVWDVAGAALVISVAASAFLLALMALAAYGGLKLACRLRIPPAQASSAVAAGLLIVLPFYIFAFSLVVMSVRSGHRAPAEFALVILAVYGWRSLRAPARDSLAPVGA